MTKTKIKNLVIRGVLSILILLALPSALAAESGGSYDFQKQSGLNAAGSAAGFAIGTESTPVNNIIATVLYSGLSLVGILFFAYIIYGAYIWMTSRGNDDKVKGATTTITNSIIGLIITLGAYAITYFLIQFFWE